jgi:hypothetical protein
MRLASFGNNSPNPSIGFVWEQEPEAVDWLRLGTRVRSRRLASFGNNSPGVALDSGHSRDWPKELVPTLCVGMPSWTLCVLFGSTGPEPKYRRRASKTAFPRGAWERVRVHPKSSRIETYTPRARSDRLASFGKVAPVVHWLRLGNGCPRRIGFVLAERLTQGSSVPAPPRIHRESRRTRPTLTDWLRLGKSPRIPTVDALLLRTESRVLPERPFDC